MFIEPSISHQHKGWIEVICGSMFSGKTEELIRRLRRVQLAGKKVEIFKPDIDVRYHVTAVVSHNETSVPSIPVANSQNILLYSEGVDVIGIDEAQFLDEELPDVCETLARKGIRVIVAGLDMDSEGKPFGQIPNLLAISDYITKVHAICVRCGDIAHFTYRISAVQGKILLGEKESYEPRCRRCFYDNK